MTTHSPETLALAARAIERFGWTRECPECDGDGVINNAGRTSTHCWKCSPSGEVPLTPLHVLATCPAGFPLCDALKRAFVLFMGQVLAPTDAAPLWAAQACVDGEWSAGEGPTMPAAMLRALLAADGDEA